MANDQDRTGEGRSNVFEVLPAGTAMPPFERITSVSVVPFDDEGNILTVVLAHRGFDIPGGHKEPSDACVEDVARRETAEEACVTLADDLETAAVIRSSMLVGGLPSYMVVLTASVAKFLPLDFGPGEKSVGRRAVAPEDLIASFAGHPFMAEVLIRACEVRNGSAPIPA